MRALLRVPDEIDFNTAAELLERIFREDMRAAFRDKLWASLDPYSCCVYEDEHRITRFEGSNGLLLLRGRREKCDENNCGSERHASFHSNLQF